MVFYTKHFHCLSFFPNLNNLIISSPILKVSMPLNSGTIKYCIPPNPKLNIEKAPTNLIIPDVNFGFFSIHLENLSNIGDNCSNILFVVGSNASPTFDNDFITLFLATFNLVAKVFILFTYSFSTTSVDISDFAPSKFFFKSSTFSLSPATESNASSPNNCFIVDACKYLGNYFILSSTLIIVPSPSFTILFATC